MVSSQMTTTVSQVEALKPDKSAGTAARKEKGKHRKREGLPEKD